MTRLYDLAKVLRSKNSGPFAVTLDVLFDDPDHSISSFARRISDSAVISP